MDTDEPDFLTTDITVILENAAGQNTYLQEVVIKIKSKAPFAGIVIPNEDLVDEDQVDEEAEGELVNDSETD